MMNLKQALARIEVLEETVRILQRALGDAQQHRPPILRFDMPVFIPQPVIIPTPHPDYDPFKLPKIICSTTGAH